MSWNGEAEESLYENTIPQPGAPHAQNHVSIPQQENQAVGGSLQHDILKIVENTGLSELAKEVGFIEQSGNISQLKAYDTSGTSRKRAARNSSPPPMKKRKVTAAKPKIASAKGKGLRHFSQKVCEKVESRGKTTYNEVADELVHDLNETGELGKVDSKNIRRRVYDALNVLMAMKIIEKEKKVIKWKGLPTTDSAREIEALLAEKQERLKRIEQKKNHLQTLERQEAMYRNLTLRNLKTPMDGRVERVQLPFIVIHSQKDTAIECEMSEDRTEYFFDFSSPFEIHDDVEILRRLGFDRPQSEIPTAMPIRCPQISSQDSQPPSQRYRVGRHSILLE